MSIDWSKITLSKAEMREVWKDLDDVLARRRREAVKKADAVAAEKAKEPCPYWSDGVHCFAPGFVQGHGYFDPMVQPNMVDAKQCQCGARVRPREARD